MRNFWLSKIDKALRVMGYDVGIINHLQEVEKDAAIREEYLFLFILRGIEDCVPLSIEEMAEYIIERRQGKSPVI